MATFNHQWDRPEVRRFRTETRTFWAPTQRCGRCGTERNPITGQLGRKGSWACRGATVVSRDWSATLERVKRDLAALKDTGQTVLRTWVPAREREEATA